MTTGRSPEPVPARHPSGTARPASEDTLPVDARPAEPRPADADVATPPSGLPAAPTSGGALADALVALREAAAAARFQLDIPGAAGARESGAELVRQLDDYVLPRLRRLDAPLLTVVGGSTGAGKSTLVNSLVRAPVTPAGVLRPTTRSPVLVCHPDDAALVLRHPRAARADPHQRRRRPTTARSSSSPRRRSTAGLAFLDAPDIDSVVDANRAARRPSCSPPPTSGCSSPPRPATPTRCRGTSCGPRRSAAPRWPWCSTGCRRAPRTTSPRTCRRCSPRTAWAARRCSSSPRRPLHDGLLPEPVVAPLRGWFSDLAARRRAPRRGRPPAPSTARSTASGRGPPGSPRRPGAQVDAAQRLRSDAHAAYAGAVADVDEGMRDGSLLRGEVLARWQEFVGTGELMRTLQDRVGRLRDRLSAAITGRPQPGTELTAALESRRRAAASTPPPNGRRSGRRPSWRTSAGRTRALLADHRRAARPLVAGPARRHRAHRARLAGRGARPGPPRGRRRAAPTPGSPRTA